MDRDLTNRGGLPTLYGSLFAGAHNDRDVAAVLVWFVTVYVAILLVLPSFKRPHWIALGSFLSLGIGCAIVLGVFGVEWESDRVDIMTQFSSAEATTFTGKIGLHIGIGRFNVTLDGTVSGPSGRLNGSVYYNERFQLGSVQGRMDYSASTALASKTIKEYVKARETGIPLPILHVLEYFTFDGGRLRVRRCYREASNYVFFLLWITFPLWIVANVMMYLRKLIAFSIFSVVFGSLLVLSCILWSSLSDMSTKLQIPFPGRDGVTVFLKPRYGWTYYLVIITGVSTILTGFVFMLHKRTVMFDKLLPQSLKRRRSSRYRAQHNRGNIGTNADTVVINVDNAV